MVELEFREELIAKMVRDDLRPSEIMSACSISKTTMVRWLTGSSEPHQMVKDVIFSIKNS